MPAYSIGGRDVESMDLTYSWGLSPASATVRVPGTASVAVGDAVVMNLGGSTFHGVVVQNPVAKNVGTSTEIQLVDNRIKLMWDDVYCSFNKAEVKDAVDGTRRKKFVHVYPADWDAQIETRTDAPLSAAVIIGKLMGATTVDHSWTTTLHPDQSKPVYNIDASNGSKLGTVLQEISEQQGLVFTLIGEKQLKWERKGEGTPPVAPTNSTDRRDGDALSNADTKIRIVGDRNKYQDMPIELVPDWLTAMEAFWSEPAWLGEVSSVFGVGGDSTSEQATLFAKSRSVTLREFLNASGRALVDNRLWGEANRMDIPAWVYIQDIVFKAYAVPAAYTLNGIPAVNLELEDGMLTAVTYDIDSGALSIKSPVERYPDSKAFVIARGQPLELLDPRTQTAITPEQLSDASTKWSAQNKFNLDVKNRTVIFEHAVFAAVNLFLFPNRGSVGEDDPLYSIAVPNAAVSVGPASVRAAMTFAAEKYSKLFGSGVRKGPKYIGSLNYHALMQGGVFQAEIPYADGQGVDQKAKEYADVLTKQEAVYRAGGYTRHGTVGTVLSGVIDRVSVSLGFGEGITERVEYTKERSQSNFEHERELDRKTKARDLFPGQKSNRVEVERLEIIARVSRELKRASPANYANVAELLQKPVGSSNSSIILREVSGQAGQVLWDDEAFQGVIVPAGGGGAHTPCATDGVVPVRVVGPFKAGEPVGCDAGEMDAKVGGKKSVGTVMASYEGSDTMLAPVQLGHREKRSLHAFQLTDIGGGVCAINFGQLNAKTPTVAGGVAVPNPDTTLAGLTVADGDKLYLIGALNSSKVVVSASIAKTTPSHSTNCWIEIGEISNYSSVGGVISFTPLQAIRHSQWHRRCNGEDLFGAV